MAATPQRHTKVWGAKASHPAPLGKGMGSGLPLQVDGFDWATDSAALPPVARGCWSLPFTIGERESVVAASVQRSGLRCTHSGTDHCFTDYSFTDYSFADNCNWQHGRVASPGGIR